MKIGSQTEEQLLEKGYNFKISYATSDGKRVVAILPITSAPSQFHRIVIAAKSRFIPQWIVVRLFRLFRVFWIVDNRAKFEVWLAADGVVDFKHWSAVWETKNDEGSVQEH